MPDLVTHGASGLLLGMAFAWRRPAPMLPLFVAGNLLPDVLCRVPAILFGELDSHVLLVPRLLIYGWEPLHQPLGMALAALALALLFEPASRGRVWLQAYLGMLLHLLMDLFQFHEGAGNMLFFPLDDRSYEIGLVGSEASVRVALPLALLAGLVWGWRRRKLPSPAGIG